ncbi:MAG: transporter [Naasia sp.]|nr:transporter [Naasia sp.]
MSATFRSLGILNYRLWFFGALVSNIGTWMQRTAQDWLVLTELTDHDAFAVGITIALQFGPMLVVGPIAGVLVDRMPVRRLLVATQAAQAALGLGLGALVLAGIAQLWMVYGFALLLGVVAAVDAPARQTFVGELVGPGELPNAVALNSASFNGARLIGPAVAGLAIAAVGTGWVFLLNGVTYAAVLIALGIMRKSELHTSARSPRGLNGFREGVRYVRSRPDVLAILVMVFLIGTFGLNFAIFTSTMARIEFGRDADAYGLLSSILAIGSLSGALGSARRGQPRIRVMVLGSAGFGIGCAVAAVMPGYWSFAAALIPIGWFAMTITTSANAYVQSTTPPALRGRVMALYMAIFAGTTLLGAPIIGAVAAAAGPRWSVGVAAAAGLLAAAVGLIWWAVQQRVRMRRHPVSRWMLTLETDAARAERARMDSERDLRDAVTAAEATTPR